MVRKKVLIVDDSTTMRKLERLMLGEQYDFVEAANGEDALSTAVTERPDIVLLDLNMPTIDGIETYRQLRQLEGFADVPVLFITGMTEYPAADGGALHSVRFPVDARSDVLRKPLHAVALREMVQRLLGMEGTRAP